MTLSEYEKMPDDRTFRYEPVTDGLAVLREVAEGEHYTNLYIAGRKGAAMLVDTGVPGAGPGVIETLEKNGWSPGDFLYIVITHEHWDHCGATAELRAWAKGAKVLSHIYCGWVLSQRWTRFIVPDFAYGEPSGENFNRFESSQLAPMKIDQIVWNENTIDLPDSTWRVWHVAGHCPGHILLYRERDKAVLAGDLLQGCTESGRWLGLLTDIRSQRQSLQRLSDLRPSLVAMGHHNILRGGQIGRELDITLKRVDDIVEVVRTSLKAGISSLDQLALACCRHVLNWEPAEAPRHMLVTMKAALAQLCFEGQARMDRQDRWVWAGQ
jgi:glyoxylase-like metal-dependent hydrolase (beta-lactamase superfamily II)